MIKRIISLAIVWIGCCLTVQAQGLDLESIYTTQISSKVDEAITQLYTEYADLMELHTIGYSQEGQLPIRALKIGQGERAILINGVHHGRETLTGMLVLGQIEDLAEAYRQDERRQGYSVRQLLNTISIWFVPMVNPDGADIAMSSQPSWKANGRGVDLNRNYPTLYGTNTGKGSAVAPLGKGEAPFSESETYALYELCEAQQFELAVAYHSAGEVLYWWYHQTGQLYEESLQEAKRITQLTGYDLIPPSGQTGGMGFTDWFIQYYEKPGYTIEIGKTVNQKPLVWAEYSKVWEDNRHIPVALLVSTLERETKPWQITLEEVTLQAETIFGRGMVAIRDYAPLYHLDIHLDQETQQVTIQNADQVLVMTLGERVAYYNKEPITLVMPPYIKEGKTYVPLKDLMTYFNQSVEENQDREMTEGEEEVDNVEEVPDLEEAGGGEEVLPLELEAQ